MATATNSEAEQQAIITILNSNDPELVGKMLGALIVDDFGTESGNEVMAKIYARMRAGKEIPKRNVLKMDSTFSDDAKEWLDNIQFKPLKDTASVDALIDTLKFHRKIRKILDAARTMAEECKKASPDDINAIESKLDQLSLDVKGTDNASRIVTFGAGDNTAAEEIIQRILTKDNSGRIKTGFNYFDSRAGGAKRGHAFLIAGPSGGGKSAMANQLLINMYMQSHLNTMFVSFEMDEDECVGRMVANVVGLDAKKVEQQELDIMEVQKLTKGIADFHKIGKDNDCWFKVWPPDDSLTASNIISYCRPIQPDVLVVDYIGLLGQDNPREEQWKSLGSAMRQFKMAAKKLKCLIIVLAQFDQESMVVKYARALREHANIMWCWQYNEEEQSTGIVTIRQTAPYGKNRNAPPFDFRVKYELQFMRIHDYGEAEASDKPQLKQKGGKKIFHQSGGSDKPALREKKQKRLVDFEEDED